MTPVNICEGIITGEFELPIAKGYNSYFYVLEGAGALSGEVVDAFDLAHFEETTAAKTVHITANEPMRFVFISGAPIKALVVAHGPFVMNTMAEIQQAFLDYERGIFVPNQSK